MSDINVRHVHHVRGVNKIAIVTNIFFVQKQNWMEKEDKNISLNACNTLSICHGKFVLKTNSKLLQQFRILLLNSTNFLSCAFKLWRLFHWFNYKRWKLHWVKWNWSWIKLLLLQSARNWVWVQVNLFQKLLFLHQQYNNRLFTVHENCKLRIPAERVVYTNCCFCFDIQNNFGTQHVLQNLLASEKIYL